MLLLHSTAFAIGDHVFPRSYSVNRKVKWLPGRRTSSLDTRMFTVQCADGIHRHHIDQIRQCENLARACSTVSRGVSFPDKRTVRAASPPRSPVRETPMRNGTPTADPWRITNRSKGGVTLFKRWRNNIPNNNKTFCDDACGGRYLCNDKIQRRRYHYLVA